MSTRAGLSRGRVMILTVLLCLTAAFAAVGMGDTDSAAADAPVDDIPEYGSGTYHITGASVRVGQTFYGASSGVSAGINSVWIESTSGPVTGASVSKTGDRSYSYSATSTGVGEIAIVIVYSCGTVFENQTCDIYHHASSSSYSVYCNPNGGVGGGSLTSVNGASVTLPGASHSDSSGSGAYYSYYTSVYFAGWYTSPSGGSYVGGSGSGYVPSGDVTLYAQWGSSTSYSFQYILDYNANGGSGAPPRYSSSSASSSMSISISSTLPVRDGYKFLGWATSNAATAPTHQSGTPCVFSYGLNNLYAVWELDVRTVTFDANGGSCGTPSLTSAAGAPITLPDATRAGYTLNGWFTALSGGTRAGSSGDQYAPAGSLTLYAEWTEALFNVTFTFSNGSSPQVSVVKLGETLSLFPDNPLKETFLFTGWFTDEACKILFDSSAPITADITLYAGWTLELVFTSDPIASMTITRSSVFGNSVICDASQSTEYTSVLWTFSDGTSASGLYVSKTFASPGDHEITLTVTNGTKSATSTQTVTVFEIDHGSDKDGKPYNLGVIGMMIATVAGLLAICARVPPKYVAVAEIIAVIVLALMYVSGVIR